MTRTYVAFFWPLLFVACSTSAPDSPATGPYEGGAGGRISTGGSAGVSGDASGSSGNTAGSGGSGAGSGGNTTGGGRAAGGGELDANVGVVDGALDVTQIGDASDAPSEGGPACAGLFCEDFEQGQIDPAKWDLRTGAGGTVMVQRQTIAHGKYALRVHGVAGASDWGLIVTKGAPAALQGTNFGRAYFLITPKPLTSGHTQMVFAGTNGAGSANGPAPFPKLRYLEVANIRGGWQIGFDLLDIAPLVEEVAHLVPPVPTMTWTCLEWQFSDQPDVVNLWVDGKIVGTFDDQHVDYPPGHTPGAPLYNGKSSGLIGAFTEFGFGFHDWHPNQPFDIFYDDIVLDTKRVNCLP